MRRVSDPETLGRYRVQGRLGKGGMGVVYRARDPDLDRDVAIKVLGERETQRGDALTRFAREAKALARITDPHVVHVYEFHAGPPPAWLAMELVNGISLAQLIHAQGPRPLRQMLDCAWQLLHGLRAAHLAGVLHRDIKPSNVLLAPGGIWKLIDFGLAWLTAGEAAGDDDRVTRPGLVVGTARYLSAEIARGGEPTAASDLFALGTTLIEMAAGRHPRGSDGNQLAQLQAAALQPLPPAARLLPDAPLAVQAWLDRMCAADPADRFPDAAAALAALPRPEAFSDPDASTGTMATAGAVAGTGQTTGSVVIATHRPATTAMHRRRPGRAWRFPFLLRFTLAIWLVASASTFVAGWAISNQAVATQTERLREQIRGLAADAALLIDGDAHGRLVERTAPIYAARVGDVEGTRNLDASADAAAVARLPEWVAMRDRLRLFKRQHPELRFVYTMARTPDTDRRQQVMFVVDASEREDRNKNRIIERDEEWSPPGEPYAAANAPELLRGFLEACADQAPTHDDWGSQISGYAPIRDAAGMPVGLVGVDVPADHITRLTQDFIWHSAVLLGSTLLAFLAAALLIALAVAIAPRSATPTAPVAVSFAKVQPIIAERCTVCHAERPTFPGFQQPPSGLLLDTPPRIKAAADRIHQQTIATRAMPIGNLTKMTEDERALLAQWLAAGAPTE